MESETETAASQASLQQGDESKSGPEAPLIHGGLWKAIWLMSWPLLLSTVATSIVGAVDVQVSGFLGPTSQAAVGLSEHIIFLFMIFIFSISVGTNAVVSREFGEGNQEGTLTGTAQSLLVSISTGLVLAVCALSFAGFILPFFTKSALVVEQGRIYLSIFGIYMIPFSVLCISGAAFRAIGDSRTPLFVALVDVIIHVSGDYLTVLANWPVPGLGIKGIACSGVVAALVAASVSIFLLSRSPLGKSLKRLNQFDWSWQKRILGIGLPSAVQRLGWAGSVFAVFFILACLKDHTAALAAWTVGMRVEALLFMPLVALSLSVSSIVGQNLGAKKKERAMQAGWNVTALGVLMMLVLASVMFLNAETIAHVMSKDAKTVELVCNYLRINALGEPCLAVAMVLMGAMQGAGDTKVNMWISLFCNWLIRLPLAYFLALVLQVGASGVWWGMVGSVTVCALLCIWRYRSGKWMLARA